MNDTSGWQRIREGDPAPMVGGPDLTLARREAITRMLALMDCEHEAGRTCDHVEAVSHFARVYTETLLVVVRQGIHDLARPLTMPTIDALLSTLTPLTMYGGASGPRAGKHTETEGGTDDGTGT